MLSVHGPREDGFHALTSVVVALDFGDWIRTTVAAGAADRLSCKHPEVPTGPENLILRAAALFRKVTEADHYFEFDLEKRIPMGAGLGGGSSNATIALKAMNRLVGDPLSKEALSTLAAKLGSDCPFFIDAQPSLMRGRGELIEPLDKTLAEVLIGQRLVLFQPDFPVNTPWAYSELRASAPLSYESETCAETRFAKFELSRSLDDLMYNSFEPIVTRKYLGLSCLLEELRGEAVSCLMSGSGSCCFAVIKGDSDEIDQIRGSCQNAFGASVFWVDTQIS